MRGTVYLFGQLAGASGFPERNQDVYCRYQFRTSEGWEVVAGEVQGVTQSSSPRGDELFSVWSHPFDLALGTATMVGWPALDVEVWQYDSLGRQLFAGYGVCSLPMTPGTFDLECSVWRPKAAMDQVHYDYFLGAHPQVINPDVLRPDSSLRQRLRTIPSGRVHLRITVIVQHPEWIGFERESGPAMPATPMTPASPQAPERQMSAALGGSQGAGLAAALAFTRATAVQSSIGTAPADAADAAAAAAATGELPPPPAPSRSPLGPVRRLRGTAAAAAALLGRASGGAAASTTSVGAAAARAPLGSPMGGHGARPGLLPPMGTAAEASVASAAAAAASSGVAGSGLPPPLPGGLSTPTALPAIGTGAALPAPGSQRLNRPRRSIQELKEQLRRSGGADRAADGPPGRRPSDGDGDAGAP